MKRALLLAALLPLPALAQQPPAQPPLTPKEQALGSMVIDLTAAEAALREQIVTLQRQVELLMAKNKELADKAQSKP
jgi:hypothetical protein